MAPLARPNFGPNRDFARAASRSGLRLFWITDQSLTGTDSLRASEIIAAEIADELEVALEQLTTIAARLAPAGVRGPQATE